MTNIVVHEWSYINTNKEGQQRVSFIASPTVKHPDKGEWASFLGAHFYSAAAGGYLNTIGKVKCSQNRLVKGSQPGNPGEDAFTKKKVILHKVSRFFVVGFFSCVVSHCVSYMSEWVCPALLFWFHSLWWCFSNHFDAVLLELGSEQCVFIFQLFNLKPKKKKMHHPQHSPQQNTALTLLTKLFPLKTASRLMYTQDYAIPEITE